MKTILPRFGGGQFRTPMPRFQRHVDHLLAAAAVLRSRRRLAELPEHLLEDVGISRDQAEAEAGRRIWDLPAHWRLLGS